MERQFCPSTSCGAAFAPPAALGDCARRRTGARRPRVVSPAAGGCRVEALFGRGPRRSDAPQPPPQSEDRGWFSGWGPRTGEKPGADAQDAPKSPGVQIDSHGPDAQDRPVAQNDQVTAGGELGPAQGSKRDLGPGKAASASSEAARSAECETPRRFNPLDALFGDDERKALRAKRDTDASKKRPLFPWNQKPADSEDSEVSLANDRRTSEEPGSVDRPALPSSGSSEKESQSDGGGRQSDIWSTVADVILPNRKRKDIDDDKGSQLAKEDGELSAPRGTGVVEQHSSDGLRDGRDCPSDTVGVDGSSKDMGGPHVRALPDKQAPRRAPGGIIGDVFSRLPKFARKKEPSDVESRGTSSDSEESSRRLAGEKDSSQQSGAPASSSKPEDSKRRDKERRLVRTTSLADKSTGDVDSHKDGGDAETSAKVSGPDRAGSPTGKSRGSRSQKVTVGMGSPMDISSVPQTDVAAIRNIFGSETFFATETLSPPGGLIFRGNLRGEPQATLAKLEERLHDRLGDKYTLCLAEGEEDLRPVVVVVPTARDRRPASPRQRFFSFAIAGLTLSTCYARAVYANWQVHEFRTMFGVTPERVVEAAGGGWIGAGIARLLLRFPVASIAMAVAVVVIISQIVQRWMARRHRTRISLPYFIPSYQLGSFGALVQVASPTPSRAALFDIALAGAATLFVVSLALLAVGLRLSMGAGALVIPVPTSMLSGSMMIGWAAKVAAASSPLAVHTGSSLVGLHPAAVVGANCLTIAALNLLPLRQLDGGRIVSAIYGRKTGILASRVTIFFLLLASSKSNYLFVFLALILFGPWSVDRPAKNELTEPNNARALLGYFFHLLMLAVLLPYPGHAPYKL